MAMQSGITILLMIDTDNTFSRYGNRELASHFIKEDVKQGGCSGFSKFFHEALDGQGDPWSGLVRESSAVKKCYHGNKLISPLHCACINPDTGPLEALLRVSPDLNIQDLDSRKLVHYAAASTSDAPLKFLAGKGANLLDTDKQGVTPLIIACKVSIHILK